MKKFAKERGSGARSLRPHKAGPRVGAILRGKATERGREGDGTTHDRCGGGMKGDQSSYETPPCIPSPPVRGVGIRSE
ncbi:hypothetical protein AKJ64_00215 [candidate division MSBL1 archaeon SCGC-AAA259E17]|uniref:Uncharacterized protein n=1 Tax=candidate division MSBL1 archaeon SCGC-AAA259E17 TaxID=1698263 RepID=A0A133UHG6_9EURY|nr:hypothetical protein AKJ64_00215 [candidate division MSBL1 archaeon SCGC-AAA259E17]